MDSFTIGGNLERQERFRAVLTPEGGCVQSLSLCVDGDDYADLWAKRPGAEFFSNGQFLGYCGLHTGLDGRGGRVVVVEPDRVVEKKIRDDALSGDDPNVGNHGILSRFPHAACDCGGKVVMTFTTRETDKHPDLVLGGYWPFHHRVQDTWWIEPGDLSHRLMELDDKHRGVYLGAFCNFGLFENTDTARQPAARCYHTQWAKEFAGVWNTLHVRFRAHRGVFEKQNGLLCPLGDPRFPVPEELNYSTFKPIAPDLDHGWAGVYSHIEVWYPESGLMFLVRRVGEFAHTVIYSPTEPDGPFFGHTSVEWQTAATNGFALFAKKVEGTGVVYLEPGQKWGTWWRVEAYQLVR